jgi:ATP-dependent DNA helicase RecQ
MMEDIKTDQFLMLTFSRPAAMEFKERLHTLIGKPAYHIDIFTYHGFAFQLLGRVGDLERSDNVIRQATLALQQEEIPTERIKSKSVIVVDEYQDISQQEYDFLKTITELADDVRVIVVGDDDQNIYEFRGSSVAFMRNFREERQARSYFLSKNYRACANLVSFSNQFLSLFRSERLKAGLPLLAHQVQNGVIEITNHLPASDLVLPAVRDLVKQGLPGTTAVLTHTNEEALLVQNLLRQNNVPARLILAQDGFSLRQLLELKCFSHYVHEEIKQEVGFITEASWQSCKDRVVREFAASVNLPLVIEVIGVFERASGKRRCWADWQAYLQEVRAEDFIFPDANKVLVSTMHKAKGKEFDHVFLLLKDYRLLSEDRKRVVYVAITRARQSLHIHTDQSYFKPFTVPQLHVVSDAAIYPHPDTIQLETGMRDVVLGFFSQAGTVHAVKLLRSGEKLLTGKDLVAGLFQEDGRCVVRFSGKFQEVLNQHNNRGYVFSRAEVAQVVVWWCQEDGKEYRVVLPRVELKKSHFTPAPAPASFPRSAGAT